MIKMKNLLNKFNVLSQKEKSQVVTLTACIMISTYMVVAVLMYEKMFRLESLSNRKQNRIEVRLKPTEIPEIPRGFTQKDLDKINKEYAELKVELEEFESKLMPINNPKPTQETKLAITYLAQEYRIGIHQLDTVSVLQTNTSGAHNKGTRLIDYNQRTVFSIKTRAQYYDFIRFAENLSSLPYQTHIRQLDISQQGDGKERNGLLDIKFDLQM